MRPPHKQINFKSKAAYTIVVGLLVFVCAIILWPTNKAEAAIHKYINYQGKLLDSSEIVVSDNTYEITFRIYDADTAGSPRWID
jgi:hypothetical protein